MIRRFTPLKSSLRFELIFVCFRESELTAECQEQMKLTCSYKDKLNLGEIKATFTRDRICSDPFGIGSALVRIHSVYTGPVLNWNGTVPHMIAFISGSIWYQVADKICTGSTRSRVNTRLIRTDFVLVPNGSGPV